MRIHPVFNLEIQDRSFDVGPYHFIRVRNYKKVVKSLYRPQILHTKGNALNGERKERITPHNLGAHGCTYKAIIHQQEPESNLWGKGGTLLDDIVFLMRLFLGKGIYLKYQLGTFPPHFQGEPLVAEGWLIKEIGNVLENADWTLIKKLHLNVSGYSYFRSCTTDMINFSATDLSIAWEVLASKYAELYPPSGKDEFLKRKNIALKRLDSALIAIRQDDREMADRFRGSLGNVSYDYLADQVTHLVDSVGLLEGLDRSVVVDRIRTFVSYIRGRVVHLGVFPEPKKGWTKRAQYYSVHAMRILYVITCARLLRVRDYIPYINNQRNTLKDFFKENDPTFRGEHPFTEDNSRFGEQLRAATRGNGAPLSRISPP